MRPIRSLLLFLIAAPLAAQTALVKEASVRSAPGGAVIALLKEGTTVTVGAAKGTETFVTFVGWIDGTRIGEARDTFPAHLTGPIAMRLRSAPSMKGAILGEVRPGTGLGIISKQTGWANVKRGGWIASSALGAGATTAAAATKPIEKKPEPTKKPEPAKKPEAPKAATPKPAPTPVAKKELPTPAKGAASKVEPTPVAAPVDTTPLVEPMPDGAMRVARSAVVRSAPNGLVVGQLAGGSTVVPLARSRGWVRVRADVWIPEKDIVPADSSFGASLSAADLRADPTGTRGKTVRWEVQVLALQYADVLRRELAIDEPYFLAKGPGSEDALLYIAIPPSMMSEARSVQPLTRLLVTARVRSGRSQPVGIPILDLLAFAKP